MMVCFRNNYAGRPNEWFVWKGRKYPTNIIWAWGDHDVIRYIRRVIGAQP